MPFAPRLASTGGGPAIGGAYHSRSRTGIDDETTTRVPTGRSRKSRRATPGSVRRPPVSSRSIASCAARSADLPRPEPLAAPRCDRRDGRAGLLDPRARVGGDEVGDRPVGIGPPPPRVDRDRLGSRTGRVGEEAGDDLRRPGRAEDDDDLRPQPAPDGVRSEHRVGRGDDVRVRDPAAGPRVGQDRPAERLGQAEHAPRRPTAGAGDDHAAPTRPSRRRPAPVRSGRRAGGAPGRPAGRPPAAGPAGRPAARGRPGSGGPVPGPTGPSTASATDRAPSGRHVARVAPSATPGPANQRTAGPNSPACSIVCGAPTAWSSGGRSAVQTTMGTRA